MNNPNNDQFQTKFTLHTIITDLTRPQKTFILFLILLQLSWTPISWWLQQSHNANVILPLSFTVLTLTVIYLLLITHIPWFWDAFILSLTMINITTLLVQYQLPGITSITLLFLLSISWLHTRDSPHNTHKHFFTTLLLSTLFYSVFFSRIPLTTLFLPLEVIIILSMTSIIIILSSLLIPQKITRLYTVPSFLQILFITPTIMIKARTQHWWGLSTLTIETLLWATFTLMILAVIMVIRNTKDHPSSVSAIMTVTFLIETTLIATLQSSTSHFIPLSSPIQITSAAITYSVLLIALLYDSIKTTSTSLKAKVFFPPLAIIASVTWLAILRVITHELIIPAYLLFLANLLIIPVTVFSHKTYFRISILSQPVILILTTYAYHTPASQITNALFLLIITASWLILYYAIPYLTPLKNQQGSYQHVFFVSAPLSITAFITLALASQIILHTTLTPYWTLLVMTLLTGGYYPFTSSNPVKHHIFFSELASFFILGISLLSHEIPQESFSIKTSLLFDSALLLFIMQFMIIYLRHPKYEIWNTRITPLNPPIGFSILGLLLTITALSSSTPFISPLLLAFLLSLPSISFLRHTDANLHKQTLPANLLALVLFPLLPTQTITLFVITLPVISLLYIILALGILIPQTQTSHKTTFLGFLFPLLTAILFLIYYIQPTIITLPDYWVLPLTALLLSIYIALHPTNHTPHQLLPLTPLALLAITMFYPTTLMQNHSTLNKIAYALLQHTPALLFPIITGTTLILIYIVLLYLPSFKTRDQQTYNPRQFFLLSATLSSLLLVNLFATQPFSLLYLFLPLFLLLMRLSTQPTTTHSLAIYLTLFTSIFLTTIQPSIIDPLLFPPSLRVSTLIFIIAIILVFYRKQKTQLLTTESHHLLQGSGALLLALAIASPITNLPVEIGFLSIIALTILYYDDENYPLVRDGALFQVLGLLLYFYRNATASHAPFLITTTFTIHVNNTPVTYALTTQLMYLAYITIAFLGVFYFKNEKPWRTHVISLLAVPTLLALTPTPTVHPLLLYIPLLFFPLIPHNHLDQIKREKLSLYATLPLATSTLYSPFTILNFPVPSIIIVGFIFSSLVASIITSVSLIEFQNTILSTTALLTFHVLHQYSSSLLVPFKQIPSYAQIPTIIGLTISFVLLALYVAKHYTLYLALNSSQITLTGLSTIFAFTTYANYTKLLYTSLHASPLNLFVVISFDTVFILLLVALLIRPYLWQINIIIAHDDQRAYNHVTRLLFVSYLITLLLAILLGYNNILSLKFIPLVIAFWTLTKYIQSRLYAWISSIMTIIATLFIINITGLLQALPWLYFYITATTGILMFLAAILNEYKYKGEPFTTPLALTGVLFALLALFAPLTLVSQVPSSLQDIVSIIPNIGWAILGYSLFLFAQARQKQDLRRASLGIMTLVMLKVLYDLLITFKTVNYDFTSFQMNAIQVSGAIIPGILLIVMFFQLSRES